MPGGRGQRVDDADYARLLAVRTALRRFEHWSADQAAAQGLTASQHQLLLAVRGHDEPQGPTLGQLAEYLLVRHHSAVELADRTEAAGYVRRVRDESDGRVVRLRVTEAGSRVLHALSAAHLEELRTVAALFDDLARTLSS